MSLPQLSPKKRLVLEMLVSNQEMYGLEMVDASKGQLKRGTVYVTLARMQDEGLVESRIVEEDGLPGPPRRFYRITGHGSRVLAAWHAASAAWMQEALA